MLDLKSVDPEDADPIEILKRDFDLRSEVSPYIFQEVEYTNLPDHYDKLKELPAITNMPFKITESHGHGGIPYKVDRIPSGVNLAEIIDEFANYEPAPMINLYEILSKTFL